MNKAYINNRNSDLDFLLSRYFRQKFSDDDSRRAMLVTNPDEANAFLIDYRWGIGTLDGHLKPVINNVILSYPYFNRCGGHDHFMICTWYTCIYYSPYIKKYLYSAHIIYVGIMDRSVDHIDGFLPASNLSRIDFYLF